jgi:hypothetical protein
MNEAADFGAGRVVGKKRCKVIIRCHLQVTRGLVIRKLEARSAIHPRDMVAYDELPNSVGNSTIDKLR